MSLRALQPTSFNLKLGPRGVPRARRGCELPTSHGNSMCTVPSATSWNMPKVSPGVVHTLSTGQRRVRRVQCPPYTHNRSKGRKREVLCTEITGEGNEGRR